MFTFRAQSSQTSQNDNSVTSSEADTDSKGIVGNEDKAVGDCG